MSGFSIAENSHYTTMSATPTFATEYINTWTEYLTHLGKLPPKENTMDNMEMNQRRYMDNRLYSIFAEHNSDLRKQFGLHVESPPSTAKELVERIQSGKFVLPTDEDKDDFLCDCAMYDIEWRDPSVKKNQEGYNQASEALNAERSRVADAISLQPYDQAVKEFEASKTWKYTN